MESLSGWLPKFLITQIAPSFSVFSYNTPFILPSPYSVLLLISISFRYSVISFYINIDTLFFFIFSFIFILFPPFFVYKFIVIIILSSCSGMFRNVPCSGLYRRPYIYSLRSCCHSSCCHSCFMEPLLLLIVYVLF